MSKPQCAPGTFSWFECGTTNAAAAKKFYTSVFGWNAVDIPMPGDMGGHYTLLKVGDADVAGLYELAGPMFEGVPSHWMTYVLALVPQRATTDRRADRARLAAVAEATHKSGKRSRIAGGSGP